MTKTKKPPLPPARGRILGLFKYASKVCGVGAMLEKVSSPLPGKSYSAGQAMRAGLIGVLAGARSAREIEIRGRDLQQKMGLSRSPCRNTIAALLGEERSAAAARQGVENLLSVCIDLRIDRPARFGGLRVASIDGIDTGEIDHGHGPCDHCLRRDHKHTDATTGEQSVRVEYYHRQVVLTLHTEVGPIAIASRMVQRVDAATGGTPPESAKAEPIAAGTLIAAPVADQSEEKIKEEGELTAAGALLVEMAARHRGRLPFDVLFGDALYANAPHFELVESLRAVSVAVFKQENRHLWQQAAAEFDFGLNPAITNATWSDRVANGTNRTYASEAIDLADSNRQGEDQQVTITRITREEAGNDEVVNTFMSTVSSRLTPKIMEALRYAKWRDLENGTFNELTNNWAILKHLFFHSTYAIESMFSLVFLVLATTTLYRQRNLRRGGRAFAGTLKQFLLDMYADFANLEKLVGPPFACGP